jgi:GNAT superfamily N-acetyltransferase
MNRLGKVQNAAYNVFETHNVYRLEPIPEVAFDAALVRPMKEGDLREVAALAKRVYRSRARKWIRACLRSGDLCYVAVADGRIVGFGMACMEGTHGRLHTLGVDPAYRGGGIAKQLHRARLEAMRRMGATDVIDEIADWNLASIRISTLSGFRPAGKVYVETIRRRRIKKNIVRR